MTELTLKDYKNLNRAMVHAIVEIDLMLTEADLRVINPTPEMIKTWEERKTSYEETNSKLIELAKQFIN